jgi:hypothetical protein
MLLHSDGFDSHATGTPNLVDGDPNWGAQTGLTISATGGKFGGKSLDSAANTTGSVVFIAAYTGQLGFAGWLKVGAITATNILKILSDASDTLLQMDDTRHLVVKDGVGTTRYTSTGTLAVSTFQWIEVDYKTGSIDLKIGNVLDGTYTGAYTAPVGPFKLLDNTTAHPAASLDDVLVWDDSGSFFNAFGLAPRRIQLLQATGAGASSGWAPNGATNWQSVTGTDWTTNAGLGVVATANGTKDYYDAGNLTGTPASVDALVIKSRQENTGSDPASLQHAVRESGGTEAFSSSQSVSSAGPTALRSTFYRDPLSVAWTTATVNSVQFGEKAIA